MTQLNDCRYDALIAQGFTGHTNDMLLAWAQSNGATSNQLNDALLQSLKLNGAVSNTLSDAWYESLGSLGITGARNDRELEFWCDLGGAFSLLALSGFTDGLNCDGSGDYPVKFNQTVNFTDHTGVTFVKNQGLAGEETLLATSSTISPVSVISYDVPVWATPLLVGDTIHFEYDGAGNYTDNDLIAMEAQSLQLINCLNPVIGATLLIATGSGATGASLTWTEPVNTAGLTTYKLYRNNAFVKNIEIGQSAIFDGGLTQNTAYLYRLDTLLNTSVIDATSSSAATEPLIAPLVSVNNILSTRIIGTPNLRETFVAPSNDATPEFNNVRF